MILEPPAMAREQPQSFACAKAILVPNCIDFDHKFTLLIGESRSIRPHEETINRDLFVND